MKKRTAIALGFVVAAGAVASWFYWTRSAVAPPSPRHSLPVLINQLDDADEWVRSAAALELAELGPSAAPAIPALIRTLRSRKPLTKPYWGGIFTSGDQVPPEAREALIRIGPSAVPALTDALGHEDALTRVHAARALWSLEKQSERILPVLLQAWRDVDLFLTDECIRYEASKALGEVGKEAPDQILPILVGALQGEDEELAATATISLRIVGEADKRAVEALIGLFSDPREGMGNVAGWRLRELGSAALPGLLATLTAEDAQIRWRAAWTIGGMEKAQALPAIPALRAAAKDSDEQVRKWATWALERVAPTNPDGV